MFISAADLYNLLAVRYVQEVAAATKTITSPGNSEFTSYNDISTVDNPFYPTLATACTATGNESLQPFLMT